MPKLLSQKEYIERINDNKCPCCESKIVSVAWICMKCWSWFRDNGWVLGLDDGHFRNGLDMGVEYPKMSRAINDAADNELERILVLGESDENGSDLGPNGCHPRQQL